MRLQSAGTGNGRRSLAEEAYVEILQDQEKLWTYARQLFFNERGFATVEIDEEWCRMSESHRAQYAQRVIAKLRINAQQVPSQERSPDRRKHCLAIVK